MSPMKGTITFRHYPELHLMRETLYLFYYLFIRYTTILLFQAHNYRRRLFDRDAEPILLFPFVHYIFDHAGKDKNKRALQILP